MMSGNKRDLERTQAFASMPVTFARRQGWLKDPHVDEQAEELLSVDERWKRWRDREEVKRLGFGAVVFDCGGTALWNMDSSSLYLDAANTPLPCHDSLWDAPSATAWSSLFRHTALPPAQPSLSHAVHLACSFPSLSAGASSALNGISRDAFALSTVLSVLHSLGWERVHARAVERTFLTPGESDGSGAKKDDGEDERKAADEVDAAQAALEAGVDYFQDRILLPPDMLARLEDPGATSGSMALFVHLTALTQRLPLRVLQPLARSATAPAQPGTHSALRSWALAGHGSVARTTAYHAAQLVALCRPGIPAPPPLVSASRSTSRAGTPAPSGTASEGPLEPFALFYAALALVAFVREGGAPAPGAGASAGAGAGSDGPELALDVLRDRSDAALGAWVHSGPLGAVGAPGAPVLVLRMLGDDGPAGAEQRRLDSPRAAARVLAACARRLRELRVWKVGDLLAGVLEQFAAVERERVDEVEYEKAGRGAGGWGALLRSDSAAASTAGAKSDEGGSSRAGQLGGGAGSGGNGRAGAMDVDGGEDDEDEDEEDDDDLDDEGEQDA
ncbi:hypothetical protein JCM3770_000903 [Rhodotorula araucariae]